MDGGSLYIVLSSKEQAIRPDEGRVMLGNREASMPRLVQVRPRKRYRLWLKYDDGTEGVVDLSEFVGRGVFAIWHDEGRFRQVRIGDGGELVWGEGVDLCADALYLKISGKRADEVFSNLRMLRADDV